MERVERIPRFNTKELFCASTNNLFPFFDQQCHNNFAFFYWVYDILRLYLLFRLFISIFRLFISISRLYIINFTILYIYFTFIFTNIYSFRDISTRIKFNSSYLVWTVYFTYQIIQAMIILWMHKYWMKR